MAEEAGKFDNLQDDQEILKLLQARANTGEVLSQPSLIPNTDNSDKELLAALSGSNESEKLNSDKTVKGKVADRESGVQKQKSDKMEAPVDQNGDLRGDITPNVETLNE